VVLLKLKYHEIDGETFKEEMKTLDQIKVLLDSECGK
jgi:hypothetical protein